MNIRFLTDGEFDEQSEAHQMGKVAMQAIDEQLKQGRLRHVNLEQAVSTGLRGDA